LQRSALAIRRSDQIESFHSVKFPSLTKGGCNPENFRTEKNEMLPFEKGAVP
jgi:hypothetical protein